MQPRSWAFRNGANKPVGTSEGSWEKRGRIKIENFWSANDKTKRKKCRWPALRDWSTGYGRKKIPYLRS